MLRTSAPISKRLNLLVEEAPDVDALAPDVEATGEDNWEELEAAVSRFTASRLRRRKRLRQTFEGRSRGVDLGVGRSCTCVHPSGQLG